MKIVERQVYEKGDLVEIVSGYRKGMVGTVVRHDLEDDEVEVVTADSNGGGRNLRWDDDEDDRSYGFSARSLKYIDKKAYDAAIKKNKLLRVDGLPVALQFKGKSLIIGDNVVTLANAKKIADFINTNTKTKPKKKA